jgi:hypothetical protein
MFVIIVTTMQTTTMLLLVSQSILKTGAIQLAECSRVHHAIVVVTVVIVLGLIAHLRAEAGGLAESTRGAGIAVENLTGDVVLTVRTCSERISCGIIA